MSDLAGQLDICLHPGTTPGVRIASSRPLAAAGVFAGKQLAALSGQLPLLFSVCGTAQALACAHACEAALGLAPAPSARQYRTLLLRAETTKEHLWRLLLDWPRALALLPAVPGAEDLRPESAACEPAMAAAMRAFLQLRAALATGGDPFLPGAASIRPAADAVEGPCGLLAQTAAEQVFGAPPADWLMATATAADLARWAQSTPTVAAALVRAVSAAGLAHLGRADAGTLPEAGEHAGAALLRRLSPALAGPDAEAFVAAPVLDGRPAETTPYSRERTRDGLVADLAAAHGNGLLTRLGALLAELARDAALLSAPDAADAEAPVGAALAVDGESGRTAGLGAAPAARGLLVHRVVLEGGAPAHRALVRGYRILAPTEWNFHPAGVVAAGLAGVATRTATALPKRFAQHRPEPLPADALARLIVTAVDPCVDYRLSVS